MKIDGNVSVYEDFKYVMQDLGSISLGAGFSYEELLGHEMVPFKLKAIIRGYILKEVSPKTTLESQFYHLEEGTFLYEVFDQLKIRVRVLIQEEKKTAFGRTKEVYREKVLSLKELTGINLARKKACGLLVREVIVSKLGMMGFTV